MSDLEEQDRLIPVTPGTPSPSPLPLPGPLTPTTMMDLEVLPHHTPAIDPLLQPEVADAPPPDPIPNSTSLPPPPPRRPRHRFDPSTDPHSHPLPISPRSRRIELDLNWMDQRVQGLIVVRDGLIRENERLVGALEVVQAGESLSDEEEEGVEVEKGEEVEEKDGGLSVKLKNAIEREIQALRAELDGPSSSLTSPSPSSTSLTPTPTPTPTHNPHLYTLIAHLTQNLLTGTRHVQTLQSELEQLVRQEEMVMTTTITRGTTATNGDGLSGIQAVGRKGVGFGRASSGSQVRMGRRQEEPVDPGMQEEDQAHDQGQTQGDDNDDDQMVVEQGESEEERLGLVFEEKEAVEGPAGMSEVEKSLLDLRSYIECSLRTWVEESKLPETVNYLNPLYPVFTLPYVPRRSGRSRRGKTAGATLTRDLPLALRKIVGKRSKRSGAGPDVMGDDSTREREVGAVDETRGEGSGLEEVQMGEEEEGLQVHADEVGMDGSMGKGKQGVGNDQDQEQEQDDQDQEMPMPSHSSDQLLTPQPPSQSVFWNPRLPHPRKRGRPSLAAMRMKGAQPTIFESLTMSAHLDPRGMDTLGNATTTTAANASGFGSGSASHTMMIDDIVYPDPPADMPTWDPMNMGFHTQVPYQIQMARQEMENRLARSYDVVVAAAAAAAAAAADAEDHRDQHHHQQQQHGHTDHVGMEGFLSEMVRSSTNAGQDRQGDEEDGVHDDLDRTRVHTLQGLQPDQVGNFSFAELDRHGLFDQHMRSVGQAERADEDAQVPVVSTVLGKTIPDGGGLPELACENCGRTGTSVWRKLTVGQDAKKRTYRVCNPCGLHYQKNSVMRPKEMWGNINDAPRRRKYNRKNRDNQTLADAFDPNNEPVDEMMMLQ